MIYKDRIPIETIDCIHEFLSSELNLTLSCSASNNGKIAPSYSLVCRELGLITNGKGANDEYAQASAYGELFERLFNLSFVRLGNATPLDLCIDYPYLSYDQTSVYTEINRMVINEIGDPKRAEDITSLYMDYIRAYYGKETSQIPCIMFKNFRDEVTFIPVPVADILLGTNGMSAGNTFEEAFIQGYSEILERKAIKDLNAGIVVPDIVEDKYLNVPIMDSLKANLSSCEHILIHVYTFERHYNFPVIALLVVDLQRKEYKIKFGAHCTLEYALERCVSEMVQGAEIEDYSKWIQIQQALLSSEGENMGIFKDGSGTISSIALENLLQTKTLYGTNWFPRTNREAFNQIKAATPEIFFVTNVEKPAFSLQVFIPHWSYINWPSKNELEQLINLSNLYRFFADFIKNGTKSMEDVIAIYDMLSKEFPPATTLNSIAQYHCPIELQYLKLITLEDLGLVVHCAKRNYFEVFKYFYKKSEESPNNDYYSYAAIFAYNKLQSTKVPTSVKMFFSESVLKSVEDDFANNFDKLLHLNYCSQCPRRGMPNCIHEQKKRVCQVITDRNEKI